MSELCIHINIPFCPGQCVHCELPHCGQNIAYLQRYRRALEKEIDAAAQELEDANVRSVHIHGDSFRLLGSGALDDMLRKLRNVIPCGENTEWVADVLPDELTPEMLYVLRTRHSFSRLNLMLMAASKQELSEIHAPFTLNILEHTMKSLTENPLEGLDVSLLIGTPGQTEDRLERLLDQVVAIHPAQVSFARYHNHRLSINEQRAFAEEAPWGELIQCAQKKLEPFGYAREGRSLNFALPGKLRTECRPDALKWDTMGFGLGARTAMENCAYHNTADIALYMEHSDDFEMICVME